MEDNDFTVWMQKWFERLLARFDHLDKFMESLSASHNVLGGERYLDNEDICQLLNVSKRTLQRYRTEYGLPYQTIHHKTYYREKDVEAFIKKHFEKEKNKEAGEDDFPDRENTKKTIS